MFMKVNKNLEVNFLENIDNKEDLVLVTPKTFEGKDIKFFTARRVEGYDKDNLNLAGSIAINKEGTNPIFGDIIFVRATGNKEHYLNIKQIDYLNDFINILKKATSSSNTVEVLNEIRRFLDR